MIKDTLKRNKFIRLVYRCLTGKHHLLTLDDINFAQVKQYQDRCVKRIKQKQKIVVAFFISTASKWKYEYLYQLLSADNRFEPIIVIVPMHYWGRKFMVDEMNHTYEFFKNYNTVKTYNEKNNKFFDVKSKIQPDVIFYSEPYGFVGRQYQITNFYKTALCCHVQYSFMSDIYFDNFYNQPFHNLLWSFYAETEIHKKFSEKYALNKGCNVVVTGYPGIDKLMDKNYTSIEMWNKANQKQKRLIWAPHHTIDELGGTANFLECSSFLIQIAQKYINTLFITFKPHPNLKPRLYNHKNWGKEKTDEYYKLWDNMDNTQLIENHYIDLFLTSDALIHDSFSFIIEYLYTKKPSCYMYKSLDDSKWNEVGQQALEMSYKSFNEEDVIDFIENVVIGQHDKMIENRLNFVESVLTPPNSQLASQNIMNHLIENLIEKE